MAHALRSSGIALMLLLSSVLLVGAIAQETDRPQEANVHGFVFNALTEDPVHALVFIVGAEKDVLYKIESDRAGSFNLYLPSGAYIWEAEAEGYYSGRGEFKVGDEQIKLMIKLKPMEVDEEEPPEFNLAGMLVNVRTGEGVQGFVGFMNPDGKGTHIETDESGHFTILLPPGPWMWKAGARGYEEQEGRLIMERDPIRLMIEMVPLQDEEPEPPVQRFGVLYGHVITPKGEPITGAKIILHPMMRDAPSTEPGIPKDQNVRLKERESLTASGEGPNGEKTRGEDVSVTSITFREFYAKLSEQFDEQTIKRIFSAADMDGDGLLNEREMLKAHTLIREMSGDGTPENPRVPERMPLEATTNEEGMFRLRVPFGAFYVEANGRGFYPNKVPIRMTPEMPEQKVKIVLKPMMEKPDMDLGRMKVVFNMVDRNSDGNPEEVHFAADLNGDGVHEVEYHMMDRTSDGNPESVEWVLDIPMDMWEKMMGIVMMFIKNRQGQWDEMPPIPDDMDNWEDQEWNEEGLPFDPAILEELFGGRDEDEKETGSEETNDLDNGEVDPSLVSDKESPSVAETTPVVMILVVVGALLMIFTALIGVALFIRRKEH